MCETHTDAAMTTDSVRAGLHVRRDVFSAAQKETSSNLMEILKITFCLMSGLSNLISSM